MNARRDSTLSAVALASILALSVSMPAKGRGQVRPHSPENQVSVDVGLYFGVSVSYCRRLRDTDLSIGGAVGLAWEFNSKTFEANVWGAKYVVGLVRYRVVRAVQIDLGATAMSYYWSDDCPGCRGSFLGLYSAAMVGYHFIFVGASIRPGWTKDRRYGSELGVIFNPELRIVIPWG